MSTDKNDISKLSDILARIMTLEGLNYEYQAGELLELKKTTLSRRKKRESLPVDKIKLLCIEKGWSFDWVMTGKDESPNTGATEIRKIRNIKEIIERMKQAAGVDSLTELAKVLKLNISSVSSWTSQGTIPYKQIDVLSEMSGKPFEWFLDGSTQCATCELTHSPAPGQTQLLTLWQKLNEKERNIVITLMEGLADKT